MKNLVCPISTERANESVVRLTAAFIVLLVVLYAVTTNLIIVLFLALDFFIRAFTRVKYSPLSWLAAQCVRLLNLPTITIDKAPKIFAARVGFLFTAVMTILFFFNPLASVIVGGVLVCFALLESALNICVGCLVYTYLVLPFFRNNDLDTGKSLR